MNTFTEEKEHLESTLEIIDSEIDNETQKLKGLIKHGTSLSFEDRKRGDHLNINAQAALTTSKIEALKKSIPTPYFGRIDVSLKDYQDKVKKIYIGRNGITSKGEIVVTDWRAPVSSIYYDSEIGKVEYDSPGGKIYGDMSLKRQINIKDSKLIDVQDSSFVTNDDLLKPYLETNADDKMKIIIASIQKEQNLIIRKPANNNMIIQGVAGSGKTSVALHRIAYLAYELGHQISSDSFLVIGPNDYFLNYVSSVLPDLDTRPVLEETFFKYAQNYTEDKYTLRSEKISNKVLDNLHFRNVQSFKTSLEYRDLLDIFLNEYLKSSIIPSDFYILDEVIFTKEKIKQYLFNQNPNIPNYDRLEQLMIADLKNNYEQIYDSLNAKYREKYIALDFNDPIRRELVDCSTKLYYAIKNDGPKLIKKYVKNIKLSTLDMYSMFISYLTDRECSLSDKDRLLLQKITLEDLKKKRVGLEDLPALIHIKYRLFNKKNKYKQIVVDESQDYGLFHLAVLRETNPNSFFAIYGDLAQSIYSYRSIKNWDEVNENIFNNKAEQYYLNKSYRTTIEITNNANRVLEHLNLNTAEPVIRHGTSVDFVDSSIYKTYKIDQIRKMIEKGYKTIAIICKNNKEVKEVYKELEKENIETKIITEKDVKYTAGIFVMTVAAAKGLEFDGVIINNASEQIFDSNSDVDMHLLYVASTRALHELCILYNKNLVSVYSALVQTEQHNKIKTRK